MSKFRNNLPQVTGKTFMTDGGQETTLIFHDGIELPEFASFTLLKDAAGRRALLRYYRPYLELAIQHGIGMILESPTWRSNADWGAKLGYSERALADVNKAGIDLVEDLRVLYESDTTPIVVSGCIGPRGDGYVPAALMSASQAADYHRVQIQAFAETSADCVTALTMNYVDEAIGIVHAAKSLDMPVVISFTLETDGRLPTGQTLQAAVEATDAATDSAAAYYMINCAHPTHFSHMLSPIGAWLGRIRGLRANASQMSHAELNESTTLDAGDPAELGQQYRALRASLTALNVIGGCCGTDHRHVGEICTVWDRT